jgi:AraC-like DNA-binding protein
MGQPYLLRPGICFVLPPDSEPVAAQDPRHRLQVFAVHFEPLNGQGDPLPPGILGLPPQGIVLQDRTFFETLARRCAAAAEREGDAVARRQAVLFVEQMLLHVWEEAGRSVVNPLDSRIREIYAEIRASPGEEWGLARQAARACLSRSQYTRRFVNLFGVAPRQFVIRCRLERAAQLLSETDMTVGETAEALGYRDLFFFSRQFKNHFGVPPGTLRRAGR